jgi:2-polyprenyl-3-methyl-5-hydroxy-6-metoxy-1,4-benzoquinol methylase
MNKSNFRGYKKMFVDSVRQVLANEKSDTLNEAAFPSYANRNPLISFLFWQRVRKVMTCLESNKPYATVMDFGCGSGVMLPFLSAISRTVVAVDRELSPIKEMEAHVRFAANIVIDDMRQKTLKDYAPASFDAVIALDVLEHVDDLTNILSDLCNLLKPGGKIIISGPTENLAYKIGRKIAGEEYSGHYHVRNIYDIKEEMARFFKVETLATLFYPIPLFKIYSGINLLKQNIRIP